MSAALGDLRLRVRLGRPVSPPEAAGIATFEDAGGAWAAITGMTAEDLRARYTLCIRRRRDVAPGWRVTLADRRLRVLAVTDDAPSGPFITLDCVQDFA